LLVPGGIAVKEDGFVVYVKCERDQASRFKDLFYSDTDCGASLPNRTRFTIAHELAHTFFFDLSEKKPRSVVGSVPKSEFSWLETSCNEIAAHLLMPEIALRADAENTLLHSNAIVALAEKYRVSVEALLRRLNNSALWSRGQRGMALLFREKGMDFQIVAMTGDSHTRQLFPQAIPGGKIASVLGSLAAILQGGSDNELSFDLKDKELLHHCRMRCVPVSRRPYSFLVTLHREGRSKSR
jgi:hypothetical protein